MKNIILIFATVITIIFFVGIIDYGEEFVNIELGIKYPTNKMFFTVNDVNVVKLNKRTGILSTIIPYFLIQLFLISIFIKIKNKLTVKQIVFSLLLFLGLIIILFIVLNVAFFYNFKMLYIIIFSGILIINYLLIGSLNRLLYIGR